MNYLVAVLSDRLAAEAAYSALEKEGLPLPQVAILGRGYKSADEFGLLDPYESAWKQIRLMATWLIPFGFLAGVGFSVLTDLNTFAWAGEIGNHFIGGLLGALSATMGSIFVGGGAGLVLSGDVLPYRNRLEAGKYLVVVKGSARIIRQATDVLRSFKPENMQGYREE
jgi:hypothetical protein